MGASRAFAASVVLPDGRLWVTGGLGDDAILRTTEILEETTNGNWKVSRGPDLPKPLFGHCLEILRNGNVILVGGFDGKDQEDVTEEFEWTDKDSGKWSTKEWSALNTKRYDHVCYSRQGTVEVIGGWNAEFTRKLSMERYSQSGRKWQTVDNDDGSDKPDSQLPHILRSATIGVSNNKLALLGGVSCELEDANSFKKKCSKRQNVYELQIDDATNETFWRNVEYEIGIPRSSHVTVNVPKSIDYSCSSIPII